MFQFMCTGKELLSRVGSPAYPSISPPSHELEAVAELSLCSPSDPSLAVAIQTETTYR